MKLKTTVVTMMNYKYIYKLYEKLVMYMTKLI